MGNPAQGVTAMLLPPHIGAIMAQGIAEGIHEDIANFWALFGIDLRSKQEQKPSETVEGSHQDEDAFAVRKK